MAVRGERQWWFDRLSKELQAAGLTCTGDAIPEAAYRAHLTPRAAAQAVQAGALPDRLTRDQAQAAFSKAQQEARDAARTPEEPEQADDEAQTDDTQADEE